MRFLAALIPFGVIASASAEVVYQQPPSPAAQFFLSARWGENGSDYDEYTWDNFTLGSTRAITEIHWRGATTARLPPSRSSR